MGCISCKDCGFPHLDLGDFARTPHSKHLCGNCGRDSTWSNLPIAATPLKPLQDHFSRANEYEDVEAEINLALGVLFVGLRIVDDDDDEDVQIGIRSLNISPAIKP